MTIKSEDNQAEISKKLIEIASLAQKIPSKTERDTYLITVLKMWGDGNDAISRGIRDGVHNILNKEPFRII